MEKNLARYFDNCLRSAREEAKNKSTGATR